MKSIVNPAIGAFQTQTPGTPSRRCSRGWKAAVALALALAPAGLACAQYDPTQMFSANTNPNGIWSYGFEDVPFPNTFHVFPSAIPVPSSPGPTINSWQNPSFGPVGVYFNGTAASQTVTIGLETSLFASDELAMNTGPNDQVALVQFSAPASGQYTIQGTFQGIDTNGTSSTVYLLKNNVVFMTGTCTGFGVGSDVTLASPVINLAVGDTLAYAVAGAPTDSMTALIDANISAVSVPEPSPLALFALALLPLGFVRKLKATIS